MSARGTLTKFAGDWRNHLTREAAEIFDHYCGDMLVAAGYEPDRSWVEGCEPSGGVTPATLSPAGEQP